MFRRGDCKEKKKEKSEDAIGVEAEVGIEIGGVERVGAGVGARGIDLDQEAGIGGGDPETEGQDPVGRDLGKGVHGLGDLDPGTEGAGQDPETGKGQGLGQDQKDHVIGAGLTLDAVAPDTSLNLGRGKKVEKKRRMEKLVNLPQKLQVRKLGARSKRDKRDKNESKYTAPTGICFHRKDGGSDSAENPDQIDDKTETTE